MQKKTRKIENQISIKNNPYGLFFIKLLNN